MTSSLLLDRTADACRRSYIMFRSMYEQAFGSKRKYVPSPKWDQATRSADGREESEWQRLARFVIREKIDPFSYICLVFFSAGRRMSPPYPNQLRAAKYLLAYREKMQEQARELSELLSRDRTTAIRVLRELRLVRELKSREALQWLLLDRQVEISSLFRYCLAASENFAAEAKANFYPAVMQYRISPDDYDRHWSSVLPEEFTDRARQLIGNALRVK